MHDLKTPNAYSYYFNRGLAYYSMGRTDLAIADYTKSLQLNPGEGAAYDDRSRVILSMGRLLAAQQDAAHAVYLDEDHGLFVLWLHVLRVRAGVDDTTEFAANVAVLDRLEWPAPVVAFYVGKTTATRALAEAENSVERCEAVFYISEWRLVHKQTNAARRGFSQVADTCPRGQLESVTARAKLNLLPTH